MEILVSVSDCALCHKTINQAENIQTCVKEPDVVRFIVENAALYAQHDTGVDTIAVGTLMVPGPGKAQKLAS
jgi:hypothetical protein